MDGFDTTVNVKVIMATNRADTLDPALLRPGRLDRKIEFPLPDRRQKRLVFSTVTGKVCVAFTPTPTHARAHAQTQVLAHLRVCTQPHTHTHIPCSHIFHARTLPFEDEPVRRGRPRGLCRTSRQDQLRRYCCHLPRGRHACCSQEPLHHPCNRF